MTVHVSFYRAGLERISPLTWLGRETDEVLLIAHDTGWSFDVDDTSLLDLNLGTTELVADGYERLPVVPSAPVWVSPRWTLPAGALFWPSLGVDEPVAAIVGFEFDTDDTNSLPLYAVWDDTGPLWTCDGTDVTYALDLGTS